MTLEQHIFPCELGDLLDNHARQGGVFQAKLWREMWAWSPHGQRQKAWAPTVHNIHWFPAEFPLSHVSFYNVASGEPINHMRDCRSPHPPPWRTGGLSHMQLTAPCWATAQGCPAWSPRMGLVAPCSAAPARCRRNRCALWLSPPLANCHPSARRSWVASKVRVKRTALWFCVSSFPCSCGATMG